MSLSSECYQKWCKFSLNIRLNRLTLFAFLLIIQLNIPYVGINTFKPAIFHEDRLSQLSSQNSKTEYALALYAHRNGLMSEAIDRLRDIADEIVADAAAPPRGDLFRLLGDWLIEADRAPEAVQAYQRSTDAYVATGDDEKSRKMAAIAVQTMKTFWRKPGERLQLLVARYQQEIRDLASQEESEPERAAIAYRCAQMLYRREQYHEASVWYLESCELYEFAPDSERDQAICHHRLADLYHYDIPDFALAREHYEIAIKLYGPQHEGAPHDEDAAACRVAFVELPQTRQAERG